MTGATGKSFMCKSLMCLFGSLEFPEMKAEVVVVALGRFPIGVTSQAPSIGYFCNLSGTKMLRFIKR